MELAVRTWVDKFQRDHDLTRLKPDEAFEAFAGFCVLSAFCDTDFDPDASVGELVRTNWFADVVRRELGITKGRPHP